MKKINKIKPVLILSSILLLLIGGFYYLITNAKSLMIEAHANTLVTGLKVEPKVPKFGSKVKFSYSSSEKYDTPIFKLQIVAPDGGKYYSVEAHYDKENEYYWGEFDIPHLTYLMSIEFQEILATSPITVAIIPVASNEGSAYHNYSLRMLRGNPKSKQFQEIFNNDSLNYPTFFERYVEKWNASPSENLNTIVLSDLKIINNIKINKDDVLSNASQLVAKLNAYCLLKDYDKFSATIEQMNTSFNNNKDHLLYFHFVRNYYFDNIINILELVNNDKASQNDYKMLKQVLEFAMKFDIKSIIYSFLRLDPDEKFANIEKSFSKKFADYSTNMINNDLNSKTYIPKIYGNLYVIFSVLNFANAVDPDRYNDIYLNIMNKAITIAYSNKDHLVSKDTNDFTTIFNGNDGFYDSFLEKKAKWFFKNNRKNEGMDLIENYLNNNKMNRWNTNTYYSLIYEILGYYYAKDDLARVEGYTKKITELEEKRGKKEFDEKIIPLRKKLNEKIINFEDFKKINSVYIPPLSDAPNVNINHSSGQINPAKANKTLIFISIDEQCQLCNNNIPDLFNNINKNNNLQMFAITNIPKQGIQKAFGVNIDVISKTNKTLSSIKYNRHLDNRIIIIKNKKIYIEDNLLKYDELRYKYLD